MKRSPLEITPNGWNLADGRADFEHESGNEAARINGTTSAAMLLSRRQIDGNESQGDTLLGEEHAHALRIGRCSPVIKLEYLWHN